MHGIYAALAIGFIAGIIDVLPMIAQKMARVAIASAFMQWLALGLVIPFVDWPVVAPWLKGAIIALLFAIPILLIVGAEDKKALIPITIMSLLLGAGVGWAGAVFV
jgi:hypothetical protein